MATHAPTMGARTRAPAFKLNDVSVAADPQPTAEFPDLERLEDIWSRLEGFRGVLGVLTVALEGVDDLGTDIPQAVFSVSYSLNDTRQNLSAFLDDLSAFKRAQEVQA